MIAAVSSNSLLAAAFGHGAVSSALKPLRGEPTKTTQPIREGNRPRRAAPADQQSSEDGVVVELSAEGLRRAQAEAPAANSQTKQPPPHSAAAATKAEEANAETSPGPRSAAGEPLTEDEQKQVREMKSRDREVRTHEHAHVAAGGSFVRGAPQYKYEKGPDGKQYVADGEVSVDSSPVPNDPEATIQKMQQVRRAALAPAEPSSQDRAVAAQAQQAEQEARAQLAEQRQEERRQATPGGEAAGSQSTEANRSPTGQVAPVRTVLAVDVAAAYNTGSSLMGSLGAASGTQLNLTS